MSGIDTSVAASGGVSKGMVTRFAFLLALMATLAIALGACNSVGDITPDASAGGGDDASAPMFGGARPTPVHVPTGYDPSKPAPLVMMLHGYGSANVLTELYWKMSSLADTDGFFYVAPNGTFDSSGSRFWNATDACCNIDGRDVDDVGYLTGLVKEIQGAYAIDPKRVYVMGHSNGGYMAHRLACDHAETFAAIVSYAGAVWADPSKCNPSAPIGVLQVHGTADDSVLYGGTIASGDAGAGDAGDQGPPYPGAKQTVAFWAQNNGCATALVDVGMSHVDADGVGMETTIARHDGCTPNGAAELWSVGGAGHVFFVAPEALASMWTFLSAHAKP
jgi:polyhydroxybutyrate depolymerase